MKYAIDFLSAQDGAIIASTEGGKDLVLKNADDVADAIKTHGLAGKVYASSSMDNADEYGFAGFCDAWDMWQNGKNLAK
jgi:hypothetical protein